MRKPLAGKRYFESLGRRDRSTTLAKSDRPYRDFRNWPQWACVAYLAGYRLQSPWRKDLHFTTKGKK